MRTVGARLPRRLAAVATGAHAPAHAVASRQALAGAPRYWAGAPWLILLLVTVVAVRVHELVPALAPLRPALLTALVSTGLLVLHAGGRIVDILSGDRLFRLMLAYFAWAVITAPFALWPGHAAGAYGIFIPTLMMVGAFAFCAPTMLNLERIQAGLVGAAAVLAAQLLAHGRMSGDRLTSIGAFDSNDIAALLAFVFPLALGLAVRSKGVTRIVGIVAVPVSLATIAATASRGGVVALAIACIVYTFGLRGAKRGIFVAALVVGAAGVWFSAPPLFRERMLTLASLEEDYNMSETSGRMAIWSRGLRQVWADPVMGVGFDNFPFADGRGLAETGQTGKWSAAHNAYVQVFVDLGIVGGSIYMMMLVGGLRRAARQWTRRAMGAAYRPELLAAMTAFCASALLLSHAYFWPLFGLLGLVYFADRAVSAQAAFPDAATGASPAPLRSEWRSLRTAPARRAST